MKTCWITRRGPLIPTRRQASSSLSTSDQSSGAPGQPAMRKSLQIVKRCAHRGRWIRLLATITWLCGAPCVGAQPDGRPAEANAASSFVLGPPRDNGPVVVVGDFELIDVNEIDDEAEVFQFTGILTLTWRDPRQAFDRVAAGVDEKVYQGDYQFNEVSTGWYPQVVLVNDAGQLAAGGVVLRVLPDGTSKLVTLLAGAAEVDLNLRRIPLDGHRLEAVFEVLGFDTSELVMRVAPEAMHRVSNDAPRVPQWSVKSVAFTAGERRAPFAGSRGVASTLVLSVVVERNAIYLTRLIVIPLLMIVLLSFAVFWMDRSSLGDRISVSFIGILTGVAYLIVMSDHLPRISYFTLMHGFLNLSFVMMCGTVVINLIVGALDRRGAREAGDRLDHRCRWIFPTAYLGVIAALLAFGLLTVEQPAAHAIPTSSAAPPAREAQIDALHSGGVVAAVLGSDSAERRPVSTPRARTSGPPASPGRRRRPSWSAWGP